MLGWTAARHAARALARQPGFSTVVIATIALGVAANASIFSVVDATLFQPLPVREPERLVRPDLRNAGPEGFSISTSVPNFKDWRGRNTAFESFGLSANRSYTLTGVERPVGVSGRIVLGDFFETLGVPPARGRWIEADETDAGAAAIAVVSDRFAAERLDPDRDPIGQTIALDGEPFEIVGVMPASFSYPSPETEVFLPMGYFSRRMCWEQRGCSQGAWAIGRLKPGVSLDAAQADLDRIRSDLIAEEGPDQAIVTLSWLTERTVGRSRSTLLVLMGAVGFVLLIACANVANLVLARGETRRREHAVRVALGASRAQVIGLQLAESLLLAVVGGVLGLALTVLGVRLLLPLVAAQLPDAVVARIGINGPVVGFALLAATLSGLLFGLIPAWRASRLAAHDVRHGNRTVGRPGQRLRAALVVVEVALSLVLLTGAGLLIRSVRNLQEVDKGFTGHNVLSASVPLPAVRYPDKEKVIAFHDRLLEELDRYPGVVAAASSNSVPLAGSRWEQGLIPEGLDPAERSSYSSVAFQMVSPKYFEVLEIPLVRGRLFTGSERDGGDPVAVVDETMAERFWPGQDPIGKRVSYESEGEGHELSQARIYRTVVGVVRNVRSYELETPSRIQIYVPLHQSGRAGSRSLSVLVRTLGPPRAMVEPIRRIVAGLDADVPLDRVETVEGYVEAALGPTAIVGKLLTVFSALAAGLAGLGLFGVLAYSVAQRVREIGVRVALGASGRQVLALVAAHGLKLAGGGVLIGLLAAVGLTRLLGSVLFEVDPIDPLTFAVTAGALLLVSLVAAVVPARRAARTDPAVVLREE